MKKCNGFTLIELMIVIAIVSVLAAIAIPSYLSYIRKSQLTEGIIVTSGLRNDIASHIWEHKQFPNAAMVAPTGSIGKRAKALDGKYVAKDSVHVAADTGVITVSFDAGSISGGTLILKPRVNTLGNQQIIEWTCSGTVSTYILPNHTTQ